MNNVTTLIGHSDNLKRNFDTNLTPFLLHHPTDHLQIKLTGYYSQGNRMLKHSITAAMLAVSWGILFGPALFFFV